MCGTFSFVFLRNNLDKFDRLFWIPVVKFSIFLYSLTPRSHDLKLYTWPLLRVANPTLFAPTGVLFSVSQILLVKLEAQVPPGSVYFLYMCSILARLTQSRDDFPVLLWKARAQKIFADSWSICQSRSPPVRISTRSNAISDAKFWGREKFSENFGPSESLPKSRRTAVLA